MAARPSVKLQQEWGQCSNDRKGRDLMRLALVAQLRQLSANALFDLIRDQADIGVEVQAPADVMQGIAIGQLDHHTADLIDSATWAVLVFDHHLDSVIREAC